LILKPESRLRRVSAAAVVNEILMETKVPVLSGRSDGEDFMP
jgi:hypothetical protein